MYDFNSPYGESCYRLMTRTGHFIYLRTRGFLDIDRDTNQVRSFVCVNTLVDEEEGKKLVKEMKKKFTIMIQETEITSNEPDVPAVENPVQLERAIISLITNLHHENQQNLSNSPETQASNDGHESDTSRSVKSPPLEIIPPKTSSIKTSIVNSLPVVNSTIRQTEQYSSSDTDDDKATLKKSTKVVRSSVVQRNANANNIKMCDETKSSNRIKSTLVTASLNSTTKRITSTVTATTTTASTIQPNSKSNTSTDTDSHSFNDTITVKQEQPDSFEDARVPPLPTNSGYFDMSPYNSQQYMNDIASPMECKPFDFLGFDPADHMQADQCRFLIPETANQYQPYDTGDMNNRSCSNKMADTPNQSTNVCGIKRSCSSEDLNSTNKRRYYDGPQNGNKNDEKLSIHIDQLTDPASGMNTTNN